MGLSWNDQVKQFVPGWLYYPHKIAKCAQDGEPELRILNDLVPTARMALDIGANRGYYSYALSKITPRVEAFEPHPELARFIRRKLAVPVHEVALSNWDGWATLYIPQVKNGVDVHYNSSLKKVYPYDKYVDTPVRVMMLDQFGFDDVGFIKIDVEGSEMDVIEGGRQTISKCRPNMVVEITRLTLTRADPIACVNTITTTFGYDARVMVGDRLIEAREALKAPPSDTYNVIFMPK